MKAGELRELGVDELGAKERDLTDQLFRMRIQRSMGAARGARQAAHRPARSRKGEDVYETESRSVNWVIW